MGVNGLINTRQRKKYRCKIGRTWKPSSIYNRSIERKFAEIFDLILDRLLMYYEWNILHELKTIFDIFEVRKFFFFFSLNDQKNLWSFEMASIKIEQFWILDGSHYVYSSVKKILFFNYFWNVMILKKNYEILATIKFLKKFIKYSKIKTIQNSSLQYALKLFIIAKDTGIFLYYSNIFQYSYKIIIDVISISFIYIFEKINLIIAM